MRTTSARQAIATTRYDDNPKMVLGTDCPPGKSQLGADISIAAGLQITPAAAFGAGNAATLTQASTTHPMVKAKALEFSRNWQARSCAW